MLGFDELMSHDECIAVMVHQKRIQPAGHLGQAYSDVGWHEGCCLAMWRQIDTL